MNFRDSPAQVANRGIIETNGTGCNAAILVHSTPNVDGFARSYHALIRVIVRARRGGDGDSPVFREVWQHQDRGLNGVSGNAVDCHNTFGPVRWSRGTLLARFTQTGRMSREQDNSAREEGD